MSQQYRPISRPFTLLDAMILVAAAGAGFALVRFLIVSEWTYFAEPRFFRLFSAITLSTSLAMPFTIAFVIIRLRPPRPRFLRVMDQPGMVACLAVVLSLGVGCLYIVPQLLHAMLTRSDPGMLNLYGLAFNKLGIGYSVAIAWSVLALSGRWRSEPGWIDRIGRALGIFWLIAFLGLACYPLLQ